MEGSEKFFPRREYSHVTLGLSFLSTTGWLMGRVYACTKDIPVKLARNLKKCKLNVTRNQNNFDTYIK